MLLTKRTPTAAADPAYQLSGHSRRHFQTSQAGVKEWLVLGGKVDMPGLAWHDDPASRCAAILLAGPVGASDLAAAIEIMPDPAAPIADFAGNRTIRNDFAADVLDEQSLAAARLRFAPIIERLGEMPFQAAREDRSAMLTLRLAFSRASPIEASFDARSPTVVRYRLVDNGTPIRVELEGLAFQDVLRRRHFMRTHACDRCASNRLLAFEACHDCGSSDLADESIVHHYRCGCQAPESSFVQGNVLACPKCRRNLKHFGMDYGKPGAISHCRNCGASSPEPQPRFACMDCAAIIEGQQATAMDWFHYDLTDAGVLALRAGQLPNTVSRLRAEPVPGSHSLREFQLLASAALRSSRRFSRPFTLAQLTPANVTGLQGQHGRGLVDQALQQACRAIAQTLSESEFVTVASGTVLIGFPETASANAEPLIAQARAAVTAALDLKLDFSVTLREGNDAIEFLGRL